MPRQRIERVADTVAVPRRASRPSPRAATCRAWLRASTRSGSSTCGQPARIASRHRPWPPRCTTSVASAHRCRYIDRLHLVPDRQPARQTRAIARSSTPPASHAAPARRQSAARSADPRARRRRCAGPSPPANRAGRWRRCPPAGRNMRESDRPPKGSSSGQLVRNGVAVASRSATPFNTGAPNARQTLRITRFGTASAPARRAALSASQGTSSGIGRTTGGQVKGVPSARRRQPRDMRRQQRRRRVFAIDRVGLDQIEQRQPRSDESRSAHHHRQSRHRR